MDADLQPGNEVKGQNIMDAEFEPKRLELLESLQEALDQSEDAAPLLDCPLVDVLVGSLEDDIAGHEDPVKGQLLSVKLQVLMRLLKGKVKGSSTPQVSPESFQSALQALFRQMDISLPLDMATVRNDLATVLLLLAKGSPDLRKEFGPFAMKIASLIFENVLGAECPLFPLHSRPEDVQFLSIIIHLLNLALKGHPRAHHIVESCGLVDTALCLCVGPCHLLDTVSGLPAILHGAWELLDTASRLCPKTFASKEVLGSILEYLSTYVTSIRAGCKGKVNLKILAIFISVLRSLSPHAEIQQYMLDANGMQVLVDALGEMTRSDWDVSLDSTLGSLLLTIAALCDKNDTQQQRFLEANGVKILLRLLNRLIYAPPQKRHMDPTLGICAAECAWRTLTSCASSLETWLAFEGMFRLLDLLESNESRAVEVTLLSALLDLSTYPRALDQVLYWKRRLPPLRDHRDLAVTSLGEEVGLRVQGQDTSLAALLCDLWRKEEAILGVGRTNGLIQDIESPLLSALGRGSEGPSKVTLDLVCSLRPKIYLLAKKIIDATNTEATLFGGLSVKNQVTMELIINFMDLKRSELSLEMIKGLQGLPLVDTDREALERYCRVSRNKALSVLDTQQYLLCRDHELKLTQERQLHLKIREATLQGHLTGVKDAEERVLTSSYQLLVDKRLWQKAQLAKARRYYGPFRPESRLHVTNNQALNVTTWEGRTRALDSEETGFEEEAEVTVGTREVPGEDALEGSLEGKVKAETAGPRFPLYTTEVTRSVDESPGLSPTEEGFYEVNPQALAKALTAALNEEKKWNWKAGDEAWNLRTKWATWYR